MIRGRGVAVQGGVLPPHSGPPGVAPALQEALGDAVSKWLPGRHPEAAAVAQIAATRGLQHAVNPLHLRVRYIRVDVAKPARR